MGQEIPVRFSRMGQEIPVLPTPFYADKWYCVTERQYFSVPTGCSGPFLDYNCCAEGQTIYSWVMAGKLCLGGVTGPCSPALHPMDIFIGPAYDTYADCYGECVS